MKHLRFITILCAFAISLSPIMLPVESFGQANINAPNGLNGRRNQGQGQSQSQNQPSKPDQQAARPSGSGSASSSSSGKPDKPNKPSTSQNGTSNRHQSVAGHRQGWRIQAFQSSNTRGGKQAATERARAIAMKYPNYRTYITYKAPSWKLRIGDFDDEEAAKKALKNLRASFPKYASEMTIVRDKVNIWR